MKFSTRPEFPPFTCPYLCTRIPYDRLGFHDFPSRLGWTVSGANFTHPNHQGSESVSSQVKLLQSWLFFGLINEISRISGLPLDVHAEFLVDDGRQVSTAALNGLARRWVEADQKTQPVSSLKTRCAEVCAYFQRMDYVLQNWDPRKSEAGRMLGIPECRVALSIAVLRRILALTAEYYSGMPPKMDRNSFKIYLGWDYTTRIGSSVSGEMMLGLDARTRLQQLRWCPSEIELLARARQQHALFFAAELSRDSWRQDHSQCNQERCYADQISEETYETVHVQPDCNCTLVSIDGQALATVLRKGSVPRIVISNDGGLSGEFEVEVNDQLPYVAISHVWSHGLGNPHQNALPRCWLVWFNDHLVSKLPPGSLGADPKAPAIWIDTLCIPVEPSLYEYRKKAIILLQKTFSEAHSVLVLDRELRQISRDCSLLELGIRVLCSGWMRRLWTLQEASLVSGMGSQKLSFEFRGGPLAHIALDSTLRAADHSGDGQSDRVAIYEAILLRDCIISSIQSRIPPAHILRAKNEYRTTFSTVSAALGHRSTSRARDEPLCVAGLMGYDTAAILERESAEERMMLLYTMLGAMPTDIIFTEGMAKISTAPFRWAPKSMLTSEFSSPAIRTLPAGTCTMDGLYAEYRGFIFNDSDDGGGMAKVQPREWLQCTIRDPEANVEYSVAKLQSSPPPGPPPESFKLPPRPALIFQTENRLTSAAIVNIEGYTISSREQKDTASPEAVCYWVEVIDHVCVRINVDSRDEIGPPECLTGTLTGPKQSWMIT